MADVERSRPAAQNVDPKSVIEAVAHGRNPNTQGERSWGNSLNQHREETHPRDLSIPPHSPSQAQGRSASLKMTEGEGFTRRHACDDRAHFEYILVTTATLFSALAI